MKNWDRVRGQLDEAVSGVQQDIANLYTVANEAGRISRMARDVHIVIEDIDRQFEEKTKLRKIDITFLFFAAALQTLRWILMPKLGDKIDKSTRLEHDDKSIKEMIDKENTEYRDKHFEKMGKGGTWAVNQSKKGYPSWLDIIFNGAPYDVTAGSPVVGISMEGGYHRYKTLGHDPLLGWVFGTSNFITSTLTLNNTISHRIINKNFTEEVLLLPKLFYEVKESLDEDMHRLPAAIFAQGVHLASDKYTKCGLPIPILGLFDEGLAGKLYKSQYDSLCLSKDLKKIGISASAAIIINMVIGLIHGLFYNAQTDENRDLYASRTRKILMWSNVIASGSNIIWVGLNAAFSNTEEIKKLDIGGIIVTLYRIATDVKFIGKIKQEFLEKEWYNRVYGEEYTF
jgi:hypothetical protein